jgi:uncharacterized protein (DUF427 family)
MEDEIKTPGPDHPITLRREEALVRVLFTYHVLGMSKNVIVLEEAGRPPVRYFPRQDIEMSFLRKTPNSTQCPYKGEASHYTIHRDGQIVENFAWSYEAPNPAMAQIAGYVAFDPEHVSYEVEPLPVDEQRNIDVDQVVQHTDSGAGASQETPWAPEQADPGRPEQPFKGVGTI